MNRQQDYQGGYRRRAGQGINVDEEKELASKKLNVENKRFFVDVKQNQRGKFIKLVEVGPNRRSRILLSFPAAADLRDRLGEFLKTYNELPPLEEHQEATAASGDKEAEAKTTRNNSAANGAGRYTEGRISSETIIQENRRYYLDLKENARGRFLRITMSTQTQRAQIVVPAQGMESLKTLIQDLLTEFATPEDLRDHITEIEPQKIRIDGRMFYFDIGSDRRGMFLRISEVRSAYRTAITIPESHWDKFRDILNEYSEKLEKIHSESGEKTKLASESNPPAAKADSSSPDVKSQSPPAVDSVKTEATENK
jgi:transcriptional activator protein Pur-alpha